MTNPIRLPLDTWKDIFRNTAENGEQVEIVWMDAVPFDQDGRPTGEVNEWVLCCGTELFEDGFQSEQEAQDRLDELERRLL